MKKEYETPSIEFTKVELADLLMVSAENGIAGVHEGIEQNDGGYGDDFFA